MSPTRIAKLDRELVWHPFTQMALEPDSIEISSAKGAELFTADGRAIIDAVSSWWVNLHGHAHPLITERLSRQLERLHHVIFAGFTHEPAVLLAERLLEHLPANQRRVFYSDDGSTAVECALKMCVQYWHNRGQRRTRVIALQNGYHGDTFGAMAAGARGVFNAPFAAMFFDVVHIETSASGVAQLEGELAAGGCACFVFEPLLQAAGGMLLYPPELLEQMIGLCKQAGVPCIADEVMTGFGRTGRVFASDYLNTPPDIFCLSKGLTGGTMPLGVTTASAEIYEAFLGASREKMLLHGHSYTGNPLACTAALASLELLEMQSCREARDRISERHKQFAGELTREPRAINPRSLGTMLAFEFDAGSGGGYLDSTRDRLYRFFLEEGVLLRPLGNTVYVLPPYCISDAQLQMVYAAILKALAELK